MALAISFAVPSPMLCRLHREIIGPLMVFNIGDTTHLDDIIWEWSSTPFQSHWGTHATKAINALHWIVFDHRLPEASGTR